MLEKLLRTWRTKRSELGLPVLCLYGLHRLLERLSAGRARVVPYAFVAQPIGSGALAAVRDDPRTVVGIAAPSSAVVSDFPRPPEVIRWRFESGATCYVATVKDRFAGFIWIRRDGYEEDEVRCHYLLSDPQRSVWDFDVYVTPEHRLGRTMGRLWKAVDEDLMRNGVRWSMSRISLFNSASLAAHARLGARTIYTGIFVVAGPMQLALFSRSPYVHFGVGQSSSPTLQLDAPLESAAP